MLTDRRPILLANARIIDPSRNLDEHGDVLIADGIIRDARRGIGAAGVPEGTDIIDCSGRIVAPGLRVNPAQAIAKRLPRRALRPPQAASPPSSAVPIRRP
jgi:hypothetical protein